jgi:hypothetical protein
VIARWPNEEYSKPGTEDSSLLFTLLNCPQKRVGNILRNYFSHRLAPLSLESQEKARG